jgi:hypothetical protein
MGQLQLFPPAGSVNEPLAENLLDQACELLAELLTTVLEEATQKPSTGEGATDE